MMKNLPFINLKDFKIKEGGYRHLPLSTKLKVIYNLNFKELSVCDDVQEHYDYFTKNINYNPFDCCNIKLK